jgi:hypothetical protein
LKVQESYRQTQSFPDIFDRQARLMHWAGGIETADELVNATRPPRRVARPVGRGGAAPVEWTGPSGNNYQNRTRTGNSVGSGNARDNFDRATATPEPTVMVSGQVNYLIVGLTRKSSRSSITELQGAIPKPESLLEGRVTNGFTMSLL